MTLVMQKLNMDGKIRSIFGLFSGARSEEEDRRIYSAVVGAVCDEVTAFTEDSLGSNRKRALISELGKINGDGSASQQEKSERLGRAIWKGAVNRCFDEISFTNRCF